MSITTSTAATGGHKPDDTATAATSASSQIDLVSCTPDELSAWLLKHRFEVSAQDVSVNHVYLCFNVGIAINTVEIVCDISYNDLFTVSSFRYRIMLWM